VHEATASIALGTALAKTGFTTCQMAVLLTMFTFLTPTGIIIGMIIHKQANPLVEVTLMAISTGTFIYVACGEVIINEFKNGENLFEKMIAMFMAGLITIGLWFIESENHTHGPGLDFEGICGEWLET
jgi:zinc transporter ZupT